MVNTIPYLTVDNALDAIELYKKIFDAKERTRMPITKEQGIDFGLPDDYNYDRATMHAEVLIGDAPVYMSDNLSQTKFGNSNVQVLIECESQEQIEKWYAAAEVAGCEITMKLEKQFWGAFFASFKDPFDVGWQMNFQLPEE
ncbi:MAG: glyoxalase/bleomycin resistance/extradiol dioxygenase family protein [Candidatus Heimdallarchaeota archaeon]|nr:glyoxalase/bleomycin resistance/extradiol dioxygenase family protein [Candidatus Heimdallarchaeota archaeon]